MRRSSGFTLLEVMISLTLLSMVMVAIIAAMRTLGNTRVTIEQATNRVDEIRVVSDFLRTTIGAAMPVVRVGSTGEDFAEGGRYGTYFGGDATHMIWVAPLLAGVDMGGAFILYLGLVDGQLQLRWQPYQSDVGAANWGDLEPRILLQSVDELQIEYLGTYGGEWLDVWDGSQNNPVAVRMNIKTGEKFWPELIIRLSGAEMNMQ
ncbi:MAG: prepilin-type N-terminal cleavage/methylation domain-containing protein [Halioglobus sp.]